MNSSSPGNILIVGTAWHGNFSRFLFSSMQNLGLPCLHISTRYEQKPNRILNALQYRLFVKKLNASLRGSIERERVNKILLIAPYNILPETWQLIKEKKIPVIGWFGDNPFTKGIIFDSLKYCDRVFLIDEAWVDRVRYLHPRVAYLPHAADRETFFPLQQNKTYSHDMVFIGDSFNGGKDGFLRAHIIQTLFDNHISIRVYGDQGWSALFPLFPCLQTVVTRKTIAPDELNTIYNTAKIVLNIHHSQLTTGTNQRTFETAAARAFQLADHRPAIAALYQGCSITFTSPEDLLQKARYYLSHGEERERMADQARTITLAHNTYKHRIEILLNAW